ncbi:MAG TPA: DUF3224 domain-containing protein [Pseudonocardiaceae bacterium]|jgi:hypothetical protein|nr:DUF3224 domain-containing protein [Pseudonocardiaceae bacterium]
MTKQVTGAFTFDKWESAPDETWPEVGRTHGEKTFTGEITGTSVLAATMTSVEGGPAVYVAIEKYEVEFDGLKGRFLVAHRATKNGDVQDLSLLIVPGSGSGDLTGITGTAEITPDDDFILTYEIAAS